MFSFFEGQDEVTQEAYEVYAQRLTKGPVRPASWQGFHSYTLLLESLEEILQFRSKASPFNQDMACLAKTVHGPPCPNDPLPWLYARLVSLYLADGKTAGSRLSDRASREHYS